MRDGFAYPSVYGLRRCAASQNLAPCVPPITSHPKVNEEEWYRNINLLSIGFPIRVRLRPD